jgi:hypothetical protein
MMGERDDQIKRRGGGDGGEVDFGGGGNVTTYRFMQNEM